MGGQEVANRIHMYWYHRQHIHCIYCLLPVYALSYRHMYSKYAFITVLRLEIPGQAGFISLISYPLPPRPQSLDHQVLCKAKKSAGYSHRHGQNII